MSLDRAHSILIDLQTSSFAIFSIIVTKDACFTKNLPNATAISSSLSVINNYFITSDYAATFISTILLQGNKDFED